MANLRTRLAGKPGALSIRNASNKSGLSVGSMPGVCPETETTALATFGQPKIRHTVLGRLKRYERLLS